ncbi:MAG: hypothetical protein K1X74_09410 [Pirellulales bacterium]|nr:hypothetical protein [Pirellulales bacterium]
MPASAQVMTAIPVTAGQVMYPLEWSEVQALGTIVLLSGQANWHVGEPVAAEPEVAAQFIPSAEFEDQTPAPRDTLGCTAFGSPLEVILALAADTVGGQLVQRFYADYVAAMESAAWSMDFGFAYGYSRGDNEAPVAADEPRVGDSVELAADPRHSLGNDDCLAINHREGSTSVAQPATDRFAPIGDFYANSWLNGVVPSDCGGLGMPVTGVWVRPAPAAAFDAADLGLVARETASFPRTVAAPARPPLSVEEQRALAARGAQQLLDATAVILEHLGGSLVDLARVLKPHRPAPDAVEAAQQAAVMPEDLHLGL